MSPVFSHAIEDYVKVIFELTSSNQKATTNELAERLEVKPASVTGMIKRLAAAEPPLVQYEKHRGVTLTKAGESVALEIIRHHRLLESFLHETLGYSWDEVHAEAERLEHVISEDLEERIAQALGNPQHDPHGEPIPSRDLRLPPTSKVRLSELRQGQEAIVQRVAAADLDLLRYLEKIGLVPQAKVSILEYSDYDDNLRLQITGQKDSIVLGPRVTRQVYVELADK